jgi:hypothetical protein
VAVGVGQGGCCGGGLLLLLSLCPSRPRLLFVVHPCPSLCGSFPPLHVIPLRVVLFVSVLSYLSSALYLIRCCLRPLAPHPPCERLLTVVVVGAGFLVGGPSPPCFHPASSCSRQRLVVGCRRVLLSQRVWVLWLGSRAVAGELKPVNDENKVS